MAELAHVSGGLGRRSQGGRMVHRRGGGNRRRDGGSENFYRRDRGQPRDDIARGQRILHGGIFGPPRHIGRQRGGLNDYQHRPHPGAGGRDSAGENRKGHGPPSGVVHDGGRRRYRSFGLGRPTREMGGGASPGRNGRLSLAHGPALGLERWKLRTGPEPARLGADPPAVPDRGRMRRRRQRFDRSKCRRAGPRGRGFRTGDRADPGRARNIPA